MPLRSVSAVASPTCRIERDAGGRGTLLKSFASASSCRAGSEGVARSARRSSRASHGVGQDGLHAATDEARDLQQLQCTLYAWAVAGDARSDAELGFIVPQTHPADKQTDVLSTPFLSEFYELPLCLTCIDRLDRLVTGLEETGVQLCRCPTEDCGCLRSSADAGCPVCHIFQPGIVAECNDCDQRHRRTDLDPESTWLCLVCGNIGCSRYEQLHAHDHFKVTGHEFSINAVTQRVWDYKADNFVHRMILGTMPASASGHHGTPKTHKMHIPTNAPDFDGVQGYAVFDSAHLPQYPSKGDGDVSKQDHLLNEQYVDELSPAHEMKIGVWRDGKYLMAGTRDRRASVAGGGVTTMKTLVNARLETKLEQLCNEYARELAVQLESQRRMYEAMLPPSNAFTVRQNRRDGAHIHVGANTGNGSASLWREYVDEGFSFEREVNQLQQAVSKAVSQYQEGLQRKRQHDSLNAKVDRLSQEHDSLQSDIHTFRSRTQDATAAVKREIADLKEQIQEMKLNLKVQKQLQNRTDISDKDITGSYTFVESNAAKNDTSSSGKPPPKVNGRARKVGGQRK